MQYEKSKINKEPAGKSPAEEVKKERLGVFIKSWKVVTSYGVNTMNSHIATYRAGQLVFDENKIDEYLSQGAPLRVYYRDVESATSSSDVCPKR